MSNNIKKDFDNSDEDVMHTAIKAGLSCIPIVGGGISEIFGKVVVSPIDKRKDEWLIRIYDSLQELQRKVNDFQMESLSENELFISIMARASQIAIMNHQEEKLKALNNAIVNTALNINIEENEQMMFLNMIDTFTPWHLKLIYYFDNPEKRFLDHNIIKPNTMMGCIEDGLYKFYPNLKNKDEFVNILIKELYNNGILNVQSIDATMTTGGMFASRLTDYGKRFLNYIQINTR